MFVQKDKGSCSKIWIKSGGCNTVPNGTVSSQRVNDEVLNFLKCLEWRQMTPERAQMKKNALENVNYHCLTLCLLNSFEKEANFAHTFDKVLQKCVLFGIRIKK